MRGERQERRNALHPRYFALEGIARIGIVTPTFGLPHPPDTPRPNVSPAFLRGFFVLRVWLANYSGMVSDSSERARILPL